MSFDSSDYERKSAYAGLKAEYLYVIIPFILLVATKNYFGSWKEIFFAPDWSLAACIIFGQVTSRVSSAVSVSRFKVNQQFFVLYVAKRFFWVVVSITCYFFMLVKPTIELGVFQVLLFFIAGFFHFSDGFTTHLLKNKKNPNQLGVE